MFAVPFFVEAVDKDQRSPKTLFYIRFGEQEDVPDAWDTFASSMLSESGEESNVEHIYTGYGTMLKEGLQKASEEDDISLATLQKVLGLLKTKTKKERKLESSIDTFVSGPKGVFSHLRKSVTVVREVCGAIRNAFQVDADDKLALMTCVLFSAQVLLMGVLTFLTALALTVLCIFFSLLSFFLC